MTFTQSEIEELKDRYIDVRNAYEYLHKILMIVDTTIEELVIPLYSINSMSDGTFIVSLVETQFNCDISEKSRRLHIMRGRHASAYLLSKYTKLELRRIATLCGQGDHTTAIHSRETCKKWMYTDDLYKQEVQKIEALIELAIKTGEN